MPSWRRAQGHQARQHPLRRPCPTHADFGLAEFFDHSQPELSGLIGTPYYMAPEVLGRVEYDEKLDVWSAGVVLYVTLAGFMLFNGETTEEVFEVLMRGNLRFPTKIFHSVSALAKDLMRRMMCKDVSCRLSAEQVLSHPWMRSFEESNLVVDLTCPSQDDFFGTNIDKSDDEDKEPFIANQSGRTLKTTTNKGTTNANMSNNATAIGSCSTTSDGFSVPPLSVGLNVDIGVPIVSQQNLSMPLVPEGLHMSRSFMSPFMQGSRIDAGESSTLPIGDNDSDSEDASDNELDDLVITI